MSAGAGSETPSNYRFQYSYTALLAMQMYNKKSDFVELICEYEDDIVAKDKDGRFTSYQVTISDYFRTVPNEKIVKSLQHFLNLWKNENYKMLLVSNQRISDILEKLGPPKFLDDIIIEKYSNQLEFDKSYVDSHNCFSKISWFEIICTYFSSCQGVRWSENNTLPFRSTL